MIQERKERTRKVIRQKFKAKVKYASSVDTVYDSDGNVIAEHKPRTKTIIQQMLILLKQASLNFLLSGLTKMVIWLKLKPRIRFSHK